MALLKQRSIRGYNCSQFVETPPEYIKCGVCRQVLRDPHLTECCGQNVCRSCIEQAETTDGPCPLGECRKPHVRASFNRKCRNDIDECRVYCSSKQNGCQWEDKLEKLERHLTECGYVEEACPYNCGDTIQRREVEVHRKVCKSFKLICKCGEKYERQHLSRHLKVCKLTRVKCPFNIVGCKVEVMNMDLHRHLNECLPQHYSLVEELSDGIKEKVLEKKQIVLKEHEEKIRQMEAEINDIDRAIAGAREKIAILQKTFRKGQEEMDELQKTQAKTTNMFADQVSSNEVSIQMLTQSVHQLCFETKVRCYGPPLPRPHMILSRPPEAPPTDNLLVPPLSFTIPRFTEKKKYDTVVYSPPFLTHNRGYKMCLKVYCNGNDQSKGKWLSIYAYLMKGEYDDFLEWPFNGRVTVEIRNLTGNSFNYGKLINFADHADPFQEIRSRVTGDRYLSSQCLGCSRVMPFSSMFPRATVFPGIQYIRNDSLRIDIPSVEIVN